MMEKTMNIQHLDGDEESTDGEEEHNEAFNMEAIQAVLDGAASEDKQQLAFNAIDMILAQEVLFKIFFYECLRSDSDQRRNISILKY